jgi:hypothetical protein
MTDIIKTTRRLQSTLTGASPRTLTIASLPSDGQAARVSVLVVFRNNADATEVEIASGVATAVSDGSSLTVTGSIPAAAGNAAWTDTPTFDSSGTNLLLSVTYSGGLTLQWDVVVTIESLA